MALLLKIKNQLIEIFTKTTCPISYSALYSGALYSISAYRTQCMMPFVLLISISLCDFPCSGGQVRYCKTFLQPVLIVLFLSNVVIELC